MNNMLDITLDTNTLRSIIVKNNNELAKNAINEFDGDWKEVVQTHLLEEMPLNEILDARFIEHIPHDGSELVQLIQGLPHLFNQLDVIIRDVLKLNPKNCTLKVVDDATIVSTMRCDLILDRLE